MLETVTGRVKHFTERDHGVAPSSDYDCHESPKEMEYYLWDESTCRELPGYSHRALPRFLISLEAIENKKSKVKHDGCAQSRPPKLPRPALALAPATP